MRNRAFSLLEILLVIFIISLVGFLFSCPNLKSVKRHYFLKEVKKVEADLTFCRKMAVLNQADIFLSVVQDKRGSNLIMSTRGGYGFFNERPKKKRVGLFLLLEGSKFEGSNLIFYSSGFVKKTDLTAVSLDGKLKRKIIW